jgi:type IV pilus assembly protein PilV
MKRYSSTRRAAGFTLIEVMVAIVVICVGLLGIAKMQALAMSNMTTSRLRSLAAIEAASLAAAMHSNRSYWANTPPASITVSGGVITSTDAALVSAATPDLTTTPNACVGTSGSGAVCSTPVNLAAYDLARWVNVLQGLLPNPSFTILCPNIAGGNSPPACTIQIVWSETAVSMTQQEAAQQASGTGQFESPSYLLYVEP